MSRVDIVVPCYNYGRYLRQCVDSLLTQEGVDVRVLIIDDCSTDDSPEIARAIALHKEIGSGTGIMIANPIPEADALDPTFIDGAIAAAVSEADARGISRKELTPFLLARIVELSGGRSLKANIALIRNNAALAARIAVALRG